MARQSLRRCSEVRAAQAAPGVVRRWLRTRGAAQALPSKRHPILVEHRRGLTSMFEVTHDEPSGEDSEVASGVIDVFHA